MSKPDQNFDTILHKFETNIYGSSKGRLRHELLLHHLQTGIDLNSQSMRILDAGGGTGIMTQEMLSLGHNVMFNDLSSEAVVAAKNKFAQEARCSFMQANIHELNDPDGYDLVICHAVLEWLKEPLAALPLLLSLVKPDGFLSLSFFNKDAHRFGNILYGNFDYVEKDMQNKNTVRLNPNNALEPQVVLEALKNLNVEIVNQAGIRCFHDYLKDKQLQQTHYDQVKKMELKYGKRSPYMWLGKYFHVILRKRP